jgi:hypothetical protein
MAQIHTHHQQNRADGKIELLTKGDNNRVGDRGLYAPGQLWLNREDILGRAAGCVCVGLVVARLGRSVGWLVG